MTAEARVGKTWPARPANWWPIGNPKRGTANQQTPSFRMFSQRDKDGIIQVAWFAIPPATKHKVLGEFGVSKYFESNARIA